MGSFDGYFRIERGGTYDSHALALSRRWFSARRSMLSRRGAGQPGPVRLATLPRGARALELGSALGTLYSFLPRGVRYTGLEVDREAAEYPAWLFLMRSSSRSRSRSSIRLHQTFDAVYATEESLEHPENPSEASARHYALLKPAGLLVGTTPHHSGPPSSTRRTSACSHP